jgi:hypothetical protein
LSVNLFYFIYSQKALLMDGFIPNALPMFRCVNCNKNKESGWSFFEITDTKSGDYHDEMHLTNFMTWVRTKLLPNLPQQAVLVKDKASYHNVKINRDPTSATKKNYMIS